MTKRIKVCPYGAISLAGCVYCSGKHNCDVFDKKEECSEAV